MARTLTRLCDLPDFEIGIVVTGQHLLESYEYTRYDIVATGLPVAGEVPVTLTGAEMGERADQYGWWVRRGW